jgi:phosphomevalonate kinase
MEYNINLFIASTALFMMRKYYFQYLRSQNTRLKSFIGKEVTISSPGKVLIAGGYLVLEKPNVGLTVSTTARFYSTINCSKRDLALIDAFDQLYIVVKSPQFFEQYSYVYNFASDILQSTGNKSNEFIEKCLGLCLPFINQFIGIKAFSDFCSELSFNNYDLVINLQADNDFYSQIDQVLFIVKVLHVICNFF